MKIETEIFSNSETYFDISGIRELIILCYTLDSIKRTENHNSLKTTNIMEVKEFAKSIKIGYKSLKIDTVTLKFYYLFEVAKQYLIESLEFDYITKVDRHLCKYNEARLELIEQILEHINEKGLSQHIKYP